MITYKNKYEGLPFLSSTDIKTIARYFQENGTFGRTLFPKL